MESLVITMDYFVDFVMLVCGIILCFWGYKAFKASITIAGIVIGYQVGSFLIRWIEIYMRSKIDEPIPIVVRIAFAFVFGLLAFTYYKKTIVCAVAYFVSKFLYTMVLNNMANKVAETKDKIICFGICLVIGVALGFLALYFQRWAIIIASAFGGSNLLATVIVKYVYDVELIKNGAGFVVEKLFKTSINATTALSGLLIIILCVVGIVFQSKNSKRA